MAATPSEADIWLAKMNVGLNRSEQVLQSWIRPKNGTSSQPTHGDNDDDEDFSSVSAVGGVGTVASADDADGLPGRKKLSTGNQKLLEQLLGKRAASAKMKEKKPHTSANGQTGSKPMPSESKPKATAAVDDSEDDEEMGRASTLSSRGNRARKVRDTKDPAYTTAGGEADTVVNPDVDPPDPRGDLATVQEMITQEKVVEDEAEAQTNSKRPMKRKATSYLDEMLAKKKNKGKKKAGGKGGPA